MSLPDLRDILPLVVGFFSGWGVSELTERRKIRRAQRALRQALIVELERAELRLSTAVSKYAYLAETPELVARVAAELRWFIKVGAARAPGTGVTLAAATPGTPEQFCNLPDAQMVQLFATHTAQETVGGKYLLPVLDSALSGRLAGFTADEIQPLSELSTQMHMLAQEADWTKDLMYYTFTVTDADNHAIVCQNHDRRIRAYARRAIVALDCARAALKALGATLTYPAT